MSLQAALLALYEKVKSENRPCDVEQVEHIGRLIEEESNLINLIKNSVPRQSYVYLPTENPETFVLVGYEIRARSIRSGRDGVWGKYTPCEEAEYKRCKEQPIRNDWEWDARELYEKVSEPIKFINCLFEPTANKAVLVQNPLESSTAT